MASMKISFPNFVPNQVRYEG